VAEIQRIHWIGDHLAEEYVTESGDGAGRNRVGEIVEGAATYAALAALSDEFVDAGAAVEVDVALAS
jgi:hypothetical protein